MPDSLTALAILALVGIPGYVYLQLVPRKAPDTSGDSELAGTLEVLLFGVTFAAAGTVLAVFAGTSLWADVLVAYTGPEKTLSPENVLDTVLAVFLAFVSTLCIAALAASAMRRFDRNERDGKTVVLMAISGCAVLTFFLVGVLTNLVG